MATYRGTMTIAITVDADNDEDALTQMADIFWDYPHEWTPDTFEIVEDGNE